MPSEESDLMKGTTYTKGSVTFHFRQPRLLEINDLEYHGTSFRNAVYDLIEARIEHKREYGFPDPPSQDAPQEDWVLYMEEDLEMSRKHPFRYDVRIPSEDLLPIIDFLAKIISKVEGHPSQEAREVIETYLNLHDLITCYQVIMASYLEMQEKAYQSINQAQAPGS